ncbi:MAG: MFS transporter [Leucobacter sp.]
MSATIRRRMWALNALFLVQGLALASWVSRTPAIRDLISASTAEMGLVLFGLSVGSMVGVLSSGRLVARFGARRVSITGVTFVSASMPVVGIGADIGVQIIVAFGLFLFGLGMGVGEIAINIEGAVVEQEAAKPFLHALHGYFSLGTVIGAAFGILATGQQIPVELHLGGAGVVAFVALLWAMTSMPSYTGRVGAAERRSMIGTKRPAVWKDPRILLIGGIVLAMALAEGTANDWLPLIMVDGHGFSPSAGSAVFMVFAISMTVGRFAGGPVLRRFGRAAVLAASAVFGVIGMALVAFVDHQAVAAVAVVLWGLGTSLGFPVAISAAGDSGPNAAARVSLVATLGYIAFLVGPPLLGFVGEHVGLRYSLIIPMVIMAAAVFFARATRPQPEGRP